jgi:diacylglycerol kinase family enzyme
MTSALLVIYNPRSGNAHLLDDIKNAFAERGVTPEYLPVTSKHLQHRLNKAGRTRGAVVVAVGGDGTVNSVVAQLYGTSCALGIIPAGTLNHFAKELRIPLDLTQAIEVVLKGIHKQVDVGTVNKHVFVNNSSIGLYPRSLRTRDAYNSHIGKWPAAALGLVRAVINPRHYQVEITIGGRVETHRTPFVFIGNNQYKRSQPDFGGRAALDTGKLAVYVIKASSPLAIIRMFAHALFTKKRSTEDFAVYLTNACTIRTRHHRHLQVACDGEVRRIATPLHYASAHKSLRVIVP